MWAWLVVQAVGVGRVQRAQQYRPGAAAQRLHALGRRQRRQGRHGYAHTTEEVEDS